MTWWIMMISWCIPATQSLSNWVRCLHAAAIAVSHVAAQNRGWPSPQAAKDTRSKALWKSKNVKNIREIFQIWTHLKILQSSFVIPLWECFEFDSFFGETTKNNALVYTCIINNFETNAIHTMTPSSFMTLSSCFLRCNHGTCSTPLHVTRFQLCEEWPSKRVLHSLPSRPRTPVRHGSSSFGSSRCIESDTRTELLLGSPPSPSLHSVHPAM